MGIKGLLIVEYYRKKSWLFVGAILLALSSLIFFWVYSQTLGHSENQITLSKLYSLTTSDNAPDSVGEIIAAYGIFFVVFNCLLVGLLFFQMAVAVVEIKQLRSPKFDFVRKATLPRLMKLSGIFSIHFLIGLIFCFFLSGVLGYIGVQLLEYSSLDYVLVNVSFFSGYLSYFFPVIGMTLCFAAFYRSIGSGFLRFFAIGLFSLVGSYGYFKYVQSLHIFDRTFLPPVELGSLFKPLKMIQNIASPNNSNELNFLNQMSEMTLPLEPVLIGVIVTAIFYILAHLFFSPRATS